MAGEPARRAVRIANRRGLHARASAAFVKCAAGFEAAITVSRDGQPVPGTSIMGLLALGAGPGADIEIAASGPDADAAVKALAKLVEEGFGES